MFTYAKAFVGGIIAGLGSLVVDIQANNHFTTAGILIAIISALTGFSGVAFTSNKPKQ